MTDAGTLEVTETIEHLDEQLPCFLRDCDTEATWLVVWECSCHHFVCQPHRDSLVQNQAKLPDYFPVQCTQCKLLINGKKTEIVPL